MNTTTASIKHNHWGNNTVYLNAPNKTTITRQPNCLLLTATLNTNIEYVKQHHYLVLSYYAKNDPNDHHQFHWLFQQNYAVFSYINCV